jgi:hypothetical protein
MTAAQKRAQAAEPPAETTNPEPIPDRPPSRKRRKKKRN